MAAKTDPVKSTAPATSAGEKRDLLLLLDGHSLAYRAFFALPLENFSTTTGQPTNAVYGFTAMLINVLRDEKPNHVAVAFDRSEPTFRHEQFVEYKATRKETPADFRNQLSLIFEVLGALGIKWLSKAGYEADDLIATLATQAAADGMRVLIVTGDRDAFQLVSEDITVLYTMRGISEMARYTPDAVAAKYGLTPAQYPDFAALRGDPSDNLPGIPGVGEKTATKWIAEFGSLGALVDRVDEVKGRAGDNLREHLDSVLRNRRLTELTREVPLDVGPHDLVPATWDRDQIHQLFDTLQFRVLRDRLYSTLPNGILGQLTAVPSASVQGGFDVDVAKLGPGQVADWLSSHAKASRIGIAPSGKWGRGTGDVVGLALAAPAQGDDPSPAAYLDPIQLTMQDEQALAAWLGDEHAPKAMHDAKGPIHALAARGWALRGLTSDTALAAYLALPGQRSFDLADLALRYTGHELGDATPATGQLTLDMASDEAEQEAATTLAQRALATAELADALDADLDKRGATVLLAEVELPLVSVLARMEHAGIAADIDHLAEMSASLGADVKGAEQGAYEAVGHEFNLGSPKQLQEVLFTELGLPKTKRIKTGYTTDSEALTGLLAQSEEPHPVLVHLLRHRDVAKLKSIVDSLIPMAGHDGRIHTTYNQMIAATGRLSSTDPNLQNIPIRTEEGRRIRHGFVVGEGYECLLTADYSQIELRIMAHLSGDEALASAFSSGHDFHSATASRVFAIPAEEVTGDLRSKIKAMNYGLAYGLSVYGLSQQLNVAAEEARGYMDEYFGVFGGVREYLHAIVAQARQDGYTETILGRRRYLPDLTSDNRQRREMAERMALNAPIQGSAADIIKVAMLRVDQAIAEAGLASRMLLQVHDELLFEVASGELDQLRELVQVAMGGAFSMTVPLDVSMGTGRSWADAAH